MTPNQDYRVLVGRRCCRRSRCSSKIILEEGFSNGGRQQIGRQRFADRVGGGGWLVGWGEGGSTSGGVRGEGGVV